MEETISKADVVSSALGPEMSPIKRYDDLNDPGIRGCQGCFYCRTHDGCAVNDYLQPMYQQIH